MGPLGNPYTTMEQMAIEEMTSPPRKLSRAVTLARGLKVLWSTQRVASSPMLRESTKNMEYMRVYCLALLVEVGEFVNELAWKPWKPNKKVDIVKLQEEFADILAFLGIILVLLSRIHPEINPSTLADAYVTKTTLNIARISGQVEGYEGVGHGQQHS